MWVLSRRKALLQDLGLDRSRLWVSMMFNLIFTITILQLIGRNQSKIDCKICVEKNIKFFFWNVGNWFLFTCAKDVTQRFINDAIFFREHLHLSLRVGRRLVQCIQGKTHVQLHACDGIPYLHVGSGAISGFWMLHQRGPKIPVKVHACCSLETFI